MRQAADWPSLPLSEWQETYDTLHMWLQIVGKVRMRLSPSVNHWWNSALYVTPRGLTTSLIPYGAGGFEIRFDFLSHTLLIVSDSGDRRTMALSSRPVAEFYREFMTLLGSLGIQVSIHRLPNEVPNPIRFDEDFRHATYDPHATERLHRIMLQSHRLLSQFRAGFLGKCSPVHFFWGSFDLCVTRFSGRLAPARPGVDGVTGEAYSHEVLSCGFWPGSGNISGPAYYAYAAPQPQGFAEAKILPAQAFYNPPTKGFVLMYDEVRRSSLPDRLLLDFFQSTYDLGANLGKWDRANLERDTGVGHKPSQVA